jgi:predicted transcriptional regulator
VARRKSAALTDAELRLMQVLWDKGHATVGEVVGLLDGPRRPVYNTVLTLLRIMEQKGYVTHAASGRAFVYSPIIDRSQARRRALENVLTRFFDGSPSLLMLNLLEYEQVNSLELQRLKALIDRSE